MDLENVILNEISQRKTDTRWYHLYVESKKKTKTNISIYKTHRYRKQTYGYQRRDGGGRDKLGLWD